MSDNINKNKVSSINLRMSVYMALFIALIIVGGYISIPIALVPMTLADFFIMITAFFLGCKYATISVSIYILLGLLGLPVFTGGTAGIVVLFGPTGGFFIGYLFLAFSIGLISSIGKYSFIKNLAALIIGNIFLFSFGILWLKIILNLTWMNALYIGFIPFMPALIIKIIASLIVAQSLAPQFRKKIKTIKNQLESTDEE